MTDTTLATDDGSLAAVTARTHTRWESSALKRRPARPPRKGGRAVVETFSTFCFCKPPHLNADNVCSCGVAWGKP